VGSDIASEALDVLRCHASILPHAATRRRESVAGWGRAAGQNGLVTHGGAGASLILRATSVPKCALPTAGSVGPEPPTGLAVRSSSGERRGPLHGPQWLYGDHPTSAAQASARAMMALMTSLLASA
jgi:hypothetical protein